MGKKMITKKKKKEMCVENATYDTKIQKVILKIFEEKLNIKEISKNKTNFQTYSSSKLIPCLNHI